jgi:hypothetical protein
MPRVFNLSTSHMSSLSHVIKIQHKMGPGDKKSEQVEIGEPKN